MMYKYQETSAYMLFMATRSMQRNMLNSDNQFVLYILVLAVVHFGDAK
jgi:hypothetical protein